ncbi:MAG: hypothetical protein ACI8WW_002713, partial [Oceanospirillaceae bacterium]
CIFPPNVTLSVLALATVQPSQREAGEYCDSHFT